MSARVMSRLAGTLYLVTHVTSVAAVFLYGGSAADPSASPPGRVSVLTGALLEIVLAIAIVGTGIALLPLLWRWGRATAGGYLALRALEASVILAGVVVLLPLVAQPGTPADPGLDPAVADGLRLVHDWTFLVGPGLIVPVHTVLLAWLLWRRGLAPRVIAALGLIGGPLVGAMNLAVMFGLTGPVTVLALPVFAWEVGLAAYLILRGLPGQPEPDSVDGTPAPYRQPSAVPVGG